MDMEEREELIRKRRAALLANGYIEYDVGGEELLGVGEGEPGTGVFTHTLADLHQVDIDALIDTGRRNLAARQSRDRSVRPTTNPPDEIGSA